MLHDKRQSERYPADVKIQYLSSYDFDTKLNYTSSHNDHPYTAYSTNVSLSGISFISERGLKTGEHLDMDVFIPSSENAVHMEGEVRWSQRVMTNGQERFNVGVKLMSVEGEPVANSICIDKEYNVEWSIVLEKILGEYSKAAREQHKEDSP